MHLIARRKLRYPRRGPEAREYAPGEHFYTRTDRDAEAFLIVKFAEKAPEHKPAVADKKPVVAEQKSLEVDISSEGSGDGASGGRRYRRRDMRPED